MTQGRTRQRVLSAIAAGAMALSGLTVLAGPAQAAVEVDDCVADLQQNIVGQSRPRINCGEDTVNEHRARANCTAAGDRYTGWVRAEQFDVGNYCPFGARGVSIETR